MLRRLAALILALAFACAPALPAAQSEQTDAHAGMPCCCDRQCTCDQQACPVTPSSAARAPLTSVATVEARATAAKPAPRFTASVFARLLSLVSLNSTTAHAITAATSRVESAASVALFRAHCSLLI